MTDQKLIDLNVALVDLENAHNVTEILQVFTDNGLGSDFKNDEALMTFYNEKDVAALYLQSVAYLKARILDAKK